MRAIAAIPAIALLLSGCGSGPARTYAVPAGQSDAVLSIWQSGGMVPLEYSLTLPPDFVMYGDGRVIAPAELTYEGYSPPLLRQLNQAYITPAEVQTVLQAADAAGLLGPDREYFTTQVTDQADTYFSTVADGATHKISAYALELSSKYPGGSAADQAAVARLLDFYRKVSDLPRLFGRAVEVKPYQSAEMLIYARQLSPTPARSDQGAVAWPVAVDPGSGSDYISGLRCLALSGADLATFTDAATSAAIHATVDTVWSARSGTYSVWVRPQYPDESGCPG
jgi:hypothetical protein